MRPLILVALALITISCLDPLVDDKVAEEQGPSKLHPPGSTVPSLHDDPVLNAKVDENDGVERLIELHGGFVNGEHVGYWNFGSVPRTTAPVWIFGTWDENGLFSKDANHPLLFDTIPGEIDYSPLWQVHTIELLPDYDGSQITTLTALPEALAMGFIGLTDAHPVYINCPIVHKDVRLDMGNAMPPVEPSIGYYRGMQVFYFYLPPALKFQEAVAEFPVADVYVLRREGGEPLSEPIRGVDMTGDGDVLDSNNLFELGVLAPGYTPIWQVITAAVSSETLSIDSYQDATQSDIRDAKQLFNLDAGVRDPIPGSVIAFEVSDQIVNLPMRPKTVLPANLPVEKPEEPVK